MDKQRLDKLIAAGGTHSRKEAKSLIRSGRVLVDGVPARSGEDKIAPGQQVTVDGRPIRTEPHLYLMMNKPQGVLCATKDDQCRTVLDLVPPELYRRGLFPAGRLDKDTEGFVLLTDDGDFAHRILSPRRHVPKTYLVRVDQHFNLTEVACEFANGVSLSPTEICSPAQLRLADVQQNHQSPVFELVIYEGMYHQIKRMFERFSLQVIWLKRIKIGNLVLDEALPFGGVREILHKDIEGIW